MNFEDWLGFGKVAPFFPDTVYISDVQGYDVPQQHTDSFCGRIWHYLHFAVP